MSVRLFADITLFSPKHEHSIIRIQRLAEHNRSMPPGTVAITIPGGIPMIGSEIGLLLFPERTHISNYKFTIKRTEIEKSCEDMPTKHFWPEVCGLITYSYPLAAVRADTGFVYRIEKIGRWPLELDEAVSLKEMILSEHDLWAGFAT
jgi:hypothetical protein